ncbi:AIPR family protein [Streptomyces coelicoflavus]|uniref:AIPR family protein n=1 Tax=Streptomyces coelicoflavus TaxID=285562 RepID=UPI0036B427ED
MARVTGSGTLQARQLSAVLDRWFGDLIDTHDVEAVDPAGRRHVFHARALAALAARMVTGCTWQEAAASVLDGRDDLGVDAVMASKATGELWLIQAKWSDSTAARPDRAAASQLVHGFRTLEGRDFERFNQRLQPHAAAIDEILAAPGTVVHLVLAVMGKAEPGSVAIDLELAELNRFGPLADLRVLSAADFHSAVRTELEPPSADLTATFSRGWFHEALPYPAYTGVVSADEIAGWYLERGSALFARNMRNPLGDTAVNLGLDSTLREQPENFWYFNNGITVLCDSAQIEFFGHRRPGAPVRLRLANASVVNGAQTTAAVYRGYRDNPETVRDAAVMVRIICLGDAPDGLDRELTRAANTQNEALRRDFIALDPVQAQIRVDFMLSLGKEYVLKRGALLPGPEEGCSVEEAATALACSHPDPSLTIMAGRGDALWDDEGSHAPYARLFGTQPPALQIWRSVQLLRVVQESLGALRPRLTGRAARIADAGRLLIAHIVFQRTDIGAIDVPDEDWSRVLSQARALVPDIVDGLVARAASEFGDRSLVASLFHDTTASAYLATAVLADLADPDRRPSVPSEQREEPSTARGVRRRPNSVQLLVRQQRIPDGTLLLYSPTPQEEHDIGDWLNADPNRFTAVWRNDARRPLRWRADGRMYSPSGLVMHMWRESEWTGSPVAVQGAARWLLASGESLAELAEEIWQGDSDSWGPVSSPAAERQDGASGA